VPGLRNKTARFTPVVWRTVKNRFSGTITARTAIVMGPIVCVLAIFSQLDDGWFPLVEQFGFSNIQAKPSSEFWVRF
jgi:hypothetical protein